MTFLNSQNVRPDLILADYDLGSGINGIEVISEASRIYGTAVPAIMASAVDRRDELPRGIGFLPKPFDWPTLKKELNKLS